MKINHTMFISKILTDLCVIYVIFCKCFLQCFSSEKVFNRTQGKFLDNKW